MRLLVALARLDFQSRRRETEKDTFPPMACSAAIVMERRDTVSADCEAPMPPLLSAPEVLESRVFGNSLQDSGIGGGV